MDILTQLIGNINDVILTYILIIMLLGCAFWFTYKTKFVQFRMIGEMVRLLGDSTGKTEVANITSPLFRRLPSP